MSIKDYEGGIITKNPTTPTGPFQDGVASGVWTMDQAAEYTKQGVWPTAGKVPLYVDDAFSTYLYTGNGTTQTVTTGLDIANEGGLIWQKPRVSDTYNNEHKLFDTERGQNNAIYSNSTGVQDSGRPLSYTSTGFTLDTSSFAYGLNENNKDYVTWNFVKQAGFFDVVTFEAPSSSDTNYRISHNLGSAPGTILLKNVDNAYQWYVYHRSEGRDKYIVLNTANGGVSATDVWGTADPTSTDFGVKVAGSGTRTVNVSSGTYIAYLFAHDDQRFGDTQNESIIKCGSYTGNGSSTGPTVSLGWEPQWLLIKRSDAASDGWVMVDVMRGLVVGGNDNYLYANSTNSEASAVVADLNATGFQIKNSWGGVNTSGGTYIYIAIRRPMKTPEAGTEVFTPIARTGTGATAEVTGVGFAPDMLLQGRRTAPDWPTSDRLRGAAKNLGTPYTQAETTPSPAYIDSYDMDGVTLGSGNAVNGSGLTYIEYFFKRAPGFFDVVAYTGTGSATTQSHNLGVVPELIIVKTRSDIGGWQVYSSPLGATKYLVLNENYAEATSSNQWNDTAPTASVFTVGTIDTNESGRTYIAYLFATVAGVSKVGSFTHTSGSDTNVDCGFTSGARFVLIKRTDATDGWQVYDTARGINSGADPVLQLNSTAAEFSQDLMDPYSAGFTITGTKTSGDYIFLAIA